MNTFTVNVVRTNGVIDTNAIMTEVNDRLAKLIRDEQANFDEIAVRVEEVFAEHPGLDRMHLNVLASYTMSKLSVPASQYEVVKERVKEYVRQATDVFHIAKGKGGGVLYLPRLSAEDLAKVEEQRTKEAAKAAKAA